MFGKISTTIYDSDHLIEWDMVIVQTCCSCYIHLYAIKQIMENISFGSTKVGAGHGINLVILSNIFPQKISGLELTDSGIEFFDKLILPKRKFTLKNLKVKMLIKKLRCI